MHSWALLPLRKNTAHARVFAAQRVINSRSVSTNSSNGLLGTSRKGDKRYYKNDSKRSRLSFVESLLVVFGSSLGLGYYSSPLSGDSHVSYADSGSRVRAPEKKPNFLFKDTYRKKVFFKYEKRIRTQSPPEKVFEYFASYKSQDGESFMTGADLMRAVVPVFPPSEADVVRGGSLKGELITSQLHCPPSQFFMLFDTDNDGLVSFAEYIFFVTILSIPESSFSIAFKMFDLDGNGGIDKEEFKKVMSLMRTQNRQGASHRDGKRFGLKVSGSVENGGLLEYFFGKEGNKLLEHDKFVQFLRDLHHEMLRLEFAHYDYNSQGTISAKDFALSMVASADMRYINKFLDRVDEIEDEPSLRDVRLTFEDFKAFAELRKQVEPFSVALFSYGKVNGLLTKEDLRRAADQVCGISLTDKVIDLVFYMFDADRDGNLSSEEFLIVLERRGAEMSEPREPGFSGLMSCLFNCTKNCSSKKLF